MLTRTTQRGHRHRSLWLQEALVAPGEEQMPLLREAIRADICVVGGGYTGLWTALHIKSLEPQTNVILLEADICGGGASGRNGGFALSWWPKIETLLERVDTEEAIRLARASEQAISELGTFCTTEGINAHFYQAGWLWTATSQAQLHAWIGAVRQCERLGVHPFRVLDAAEVQRRTGSSVHLGGVFEASGATVQPALLARGLRRVALRRGVCMYEQTPVMRIDRDRGTVYTPQGSVQASVIVLATNAWAARISELRRAIVPLSSDMVATAPMQHILCNMGWTNGESISNSRLMVHYYRTTQDGRIAFGKGGGAIGMLGRFSNNFDYSARRTEDVIHDLWRLVPQSQPVTVTHAWGGAVDRSKDGLPFFGRLHAKRPILYGVGFSGNGVAPCFLAGKILASTALGRQDEWSACGLNRGIPSRFPSEPIRGVGGILVREAVRRKETREDRNQRVDPLTVRLAALAPSGFFKVTSASDRSDEVFDTVIRT